jgi:hypothetical protein
MKLLLVGDGSAYIDVSKAEIFNVRGVSYYRSEHGVWVRKERRRSSGHVIQEREVFKAFISARMFMQAEENFQELFEDGFKLNATVEPSTNSAERKTWLLFRFAASSLVGLLLFGYIAAVVTGKISASRQISLADVGIIAIGVVAISIVLRPQLVRNIRRFEFGSLRLELRDKLRDLQDTQQDQRRDLDEVRFTLEALVTEDELRHLEHLAKGSHSTYKRNESLQAELRRLRSIGLIKSMRNIWEMPDEFDLAEWVALTDRGIDYLRRLKKIEAAGSASTRAQPVPGDRIAD